MTANRNEALSGSVLCVFLFLIIIVVIKVVILLSVFVLFTIRRPMTYHITDDTIQASPNRALETTKYYSLGD